MQKQGKNNEKVWLEDFDPTTAGSRTWTQSRFSANVSRKAGPRTWTHPPGVTQRGTTTGKHNGETKREQFFFEKINYIYAFLKKNKNYIYAFFFKLNYFKYFLKNAYIYNFYFFLKKMHIYNLKIFFFF